MYHGSQKTAPCYFCSNFVKLSYILTIFGTYTLINFLPKAYFMIFTTSKTENQLKFHSTSRQQNVFTTVKLLCRKTPDFIIAPNLWLLNMSDSSSVDYRILAVLQEWVCQYPMRNIDKLRQRLNDRQTIIDQFYY